MNVYICFYNGNKCEVRAPTSYAAHIKAAEVMKVRPSKRHMISVCLAEKDGQQVTTDAAQLPGA